MTYPAQQTVYVNAWDSDSSGGFDWYPDEVAADRAFEAEKVNCAAHVSQRWAAYRFDIELPASLSADEVTRFIDADLRHHCDKAPRKHGFNRACAGEAATTPHTVTFECTGFSSVDVDGNEFSEEEARGYTDVALVERTFPPGVLAVVGGHIAEDDAQHGSDRRVFVNITLRMAAMINADTRDFVPPVDLLTALADRICADEDGNTTVHLEANWLCVDAVPDEETMAARH